MTRSELTYADYLQVERLLSIQNPRSDEHDEMLFIVIHQVYELWFKQVLWELDHLKRLFSAGQLFPSIHTLKRLRTIFKTLVGQLDILETMTPLSFTAFRDRLETSSGFQSTQFREFEFVLGSKRESMLRHLPQGTAGLEGVRRRLREGSIVDHFYEFLATQGVDVPQELRTKDVTESTRPSSAIQRAVLQLYKSRPELGILFELMLDLDEGLQEWRYRHVKIVERTIGNKGGTGGSLGVEYLRKSLFQPVFPDLWAVRHEL